MRELAHKVKRIREHLQDETSKFLFDNRLLYALTGDYRYIEQIIMSLPQKKELDAAVMRCREHADKLILWGAGNDLEILSQLYPDLPIHCLCDRDERRQQSGWRGVPVISPEELAERREEVYVAVNTSAFQGEIVDFLVKNGFEGDRIINLGAIADSLCSKQYFDRDIMSPGKGEVFIDGGCYNCSTDKAFIKWCGRDYKKIFAFEPDAENYAKCLRKCEEEGIRDIELYPKGLWDCETELSFEAGGGQGSKIGDQGADVVKISTVAIDDVAGGEEVSLIKLDVEGAELKALQGAAQTIQRFRPRLAVSIYHKPEDVIEILEYILSLHEDYKFYIRHYQMSPCETIVYAI